MGEKAEKEGQTKDKIFITESFGVDIFFILNSIPVLTWTSGHSLLEINPRPGADGTAGQDVITLVW